MPALMSREILEERLLDVVLSVENAEDLFPTMSIDRNSLPRQMLQEDLTLKEWEAMSPEEVKATLQALDLDYLHLDYLQFVSDHVDQPGQPTETDDPGGTDTDRVGSDEPGGGEGDTSGSGLGLPPISEKSEQDNPFDGLFDEDDEGSTIHGSGGADLSDRDMKQAAQVLDRWINKAGRKDYEPLIPLAVKQFGEAKARNIMGVVRRAWDRIKAGGARPYYHRKNASAPKGRFELEWPLALNAPPGKWTLELRDAASGVTRSLTFEVR